MTLTIADSGQMANPAVPGATPIFKEVRAVVPTPVPAAFEGDTVWVSIRIWVQPEPPRLKSETWATHLIFVRAVLSLSGSEKSGQLPIHYESPG